jgi:hypothetical protein
MEEPELAPARPAKETELNSEDFRKQVFKADVVLGRDEQTGNEFVVYGRRFLQDSVELNRGVGAKIMYISILQATEELEMLLAAVQVAKGSHEYWITQELRSDTEKCVDELALPDYVTFGEPPDLPLADRCIAS